MRKGSGMRVEYEGKSYNLPSLREEYEWFLEQRKGNLLLQIVIPRLLKHKIIDEQIVGKLVEITRENFYDLLFEAAKKIGPLRFTPDVFMLPATKSDNVYTETQEYISVTIYDTDSDNVVTRKLGELLHYYRGWRGDEIIFSDFIKEPGEREGSIKIKFAGSYSRVGEGLNPLLYPYAKIVPNKEILEDADNIQKLLSL